MLTYHNSALCVHLSASVHEINPQHAFWNYTFKIATNESKYDIALITAITKEKDSLDIELKEDPLYPALTYKLWGVSCDFIEKTVS